LQYSHASEQIHKHSAKNKDYKIIRKNNYVFFPQTLESRETQWGKFNYHIWYAVLEVRETET
jgi:hypothetical protein